MEIAAGDTFTFDPSDDTSSLTLSSEQPLAHSTLFTATHKDGRPGALILRCSDIAGTKTSPCVTSVRDNAIEVTNNGVHGVTANLSSSFDIEEMSSESETPGGPATAETASTKGFVGVPGHYIYDPSWSRWGVYKIQHDYCSFSSDDAMGANLRGPCANHDLCYERYNHVGGYKVPNMAKAAGRNSDCQKPFGSQMKQNCDHAHPGWNNPRKYACYAWAAGMVDTVIKYSPTQP